MQAFFWLTRIFKDNSFSYTWTIPYIFICFYLFTLLAARQGLAVLMASAVVVLKHETSTLRQSLNFISIDLKFGMSDYVREVTKPDKVGSDPIWLNMFQSLLKTSFSYSTKAKRCNSQRYGPFLRNGD